MGDVPLGATHEELHRAASEDKEMLNDAGGEDHESTKPGNDKRKSKILHLVKSVAKVIVKTVVSADKIRAKTGSQAAKHRLGAASVTQEPAVAGPIEFKVRYDGDEGFLYLTTDSESPSLCFSLRSSRAGSNGVIHDTLQPKWVLPISEITELNKHSGYGAKAKLVAGWALGEEILDGIEIMDKQNRTTLITAIAQRDELFNRLCAIGTQKWEIW